MKKIKFGIYVILCVMCLWGGVLLRTEAAPGFNLLKQVSVKSTPAGTWVRSSRGYRYRLSGTGTYARGTWLNRKGKIYYVDKNGFRVTGLKKYKGNYYFLNAKGVLKLRWKTLKGKRYYFSELTGAALTGWKNIGSDRYYFDESGVMQKNCWVSDCYLGPEGIMVRDTIVDGYYVDADGRKIDVALEDGEPEETLSGYIFVGDSRTVGLQNTVGGDHTYIGKVGEGYQWLSTTGIRLLKKALKKEPQSRVIINLGVNDLANIGNYLSAYQNLIVTYPQARFYFMSVNPIETKLARANGYNTSLVNNQTIENFNASLRAAFPGAYLDCYSYLLNQELIQNKKAGVGTVDGIHYKTNVYWAIYNFVISATG